MRGRHRTLYTHTNIDVVDNDVILFFDLSLRLLKRVGTGAPVERQRERERRKATTTINYSTQACVCRAHILARRATNNQLTHSFYKYIHTYINSQRFKLLIEYHEEKRENVSNKNIDYFDLDIHSQITSLWSGLTYIVSEIICQSKLSSIDDKKGKTKKKKKKGSLRNITRTKGKKK